MLIFNFSSIFLKEKNAELLIESRTFVPHEGFVLNVPMSFDPIGAIYRICASGLGGDTSDRLNNWLRIQYLSPHYRGRPAP